MSQPNRNRKQKKLVKRNDARQRIYRPPQAIAPPHQWVLLSYPMEFSVSGAGTSFDKRFNPNAALNPEVGSATKPNGFAQWATIYNQYRVFWYRYEYDAANLEAFPVYVYTSNSNSDPGTTATGAIIGRPNTQKRLLSAKGGQDRATDVKARYTINHIVGQNTTIDDKYSALCNTIPADVTWLSCGVQSSGGSNLTNGAIWFGRLFMMVKFYDILLL